jgi:outer membrane protein assembly factor BamE (lipoprotein component of BamABCDE complex)
MSERLKVAISFLGIFLCGCVARVEQKGCCIQAFDLSEIKERIDTKATIMERYGKPSTISIFNQDQERWYYVHRVISELPIRGKKTNLHKSIVITFNNEGVVEKKEIITGEKDISICRDVTKEPGYKTTFLKETFKNIGKFGQSGGVLK